MGLIWGQGVKWRSSAGFPLYGCPVVQAPRLHAVQRAGDNSPLLTTAEKMISMLGYRFYDFYSLFYYY